MQEVGGERLKASQALLLRVTHWELETSDFFKYGGRSIFDCTTLMKSNGIREIEPKQFRGGM